MDLMFAFGAFGVIMSFTPLMGDEVPENWKYGTSAVASIITIGNLAGVMNPEFNTSPFNFFWAFTMVDFAVSGVVGQVWRYMLLVAGLFGLFFTGADMFSTRITRITCSIISWRICNVYSWIRCRTAFSLE